MKEFTNHLILAFVTFVFIILCVQQDVAAQSGDLQLTIYQSGFSTIHDVRNFDLNRGENEIYFDNIPNQIDPASIFINYDGSVIRQTFNTDNYSHEAFYRFLIGNDVILESIYGSEIRGRVVDYKNGFMMLETQDGSLQTISQVQNYTVQSDALTRESISGAKITAVIESRRGGSSEVGAHYQFGGLEWRTDYFAKVSEDESKMLVESRAVISNNTGIDIQDAQVRLLAGDVNRVRGRQVHMARSMDMEAGSSNLPQQGGIFEYQRFDLPERVSLKNAETLTTPLLSTREVDVQKQFYYRAGRMGSRVQSGDIAIRFITENSEENGLGIPLPAGRFRVFQEDNNRIEFLGEDQISNTQVDQELAIVTGNAFDLRAEEEIIVSGRSGGQKVTETRKLTLFSSRDEDSDIIIEFPLRSNETLLADDVIGRNKLVLTVPANESISIEFKIKREE